MLGDALREAREKAGWTLDQVVGATGMARSHLWAAERDQTRLTFEKMVRLARFYGASLDQLAEWVDVSMVDAWLDGYARANEARADQARALLNGARDGGA